MARLAGRVRRLAKVSQGASSRVRRYSKSHGSARIRSARIRSARLGSARIGSAQIGSDRIGSASFQQSQGSGRVSRF